MLLSYNSNEFTIPHTSICTVKTIGKINDGDTVTITSPIFSSIDFKSGAFKMASSFDVPIHVMNSNKYVEYDHEHTATLVCDDNDIFNMYVRES